MTLTHEVQFADFDPNAGVLAGEATVQELAPTAEALGAAALPVSGLYFAAREREERPSDVARQQLNTDDGRAKAERRKKTEDDRRALRDVESDPDSR